MARVSVMFATVAALSLLAGLVIPLPFGLSVHLASINYGLSGRATCFIIAAVFSVFAAFYSLWMLPMSGQASNWHFWMTLASIAAFFGYLAILGKGNFERAWLAFLCFVVFGVAFALAQTVFLVNLASAIYKLAKHGLISTVG